MSAVGTGLELGVELYADIERMVRDLNGLHKLAGRRGARDLHALIFNLLAEIVVELVTVAVTLGNHFLAVRRCHDSIRTDLARISAQTHRAALLGDALLALHQVDDGWVESGSNSLEFASA